MYLTLQIYFIFFAVLIFLYPVDSSNLVSFCWLWVLSRLVNYYLMLKAYLMYRRLRSDFGKMGLPFPAFKFIPIWERDVNQKNFK
jgi:hypothetical protein